MKKVLLALLVSLGLQTQAQTLCDSNMTYTIGSQYQLEIAIPVTGNSLPTMAPLYAVTYGGQTMLGQDSCFSGPCTHMVYNYNPNGTYYDTITTCISYTLTDTLGYVDTLKCCFNQLWNGTAWMMMNMGNPTGLPGFVIEEDGVRWWNDIMYDMLGKEITEAPIGTMYIRGGKKYIKIK